MSKVTAQEKQESIDALRKMVKPGRTVYTVLRHVTASGMLRVIDLYIIEGGAPRWITFHVARALGEPRDKKREGIRVGGCGMDMGFHLVHNLGHALYRDGFTCRGKNCPSNDHSNGMARPSRPTKAIRHTEGGYALKHSWI